MPVQTQITPAEAVELLGDLRPLLEQLGSPAGLAAFAGRSAGLDGHPIRTVPELRTFLTDYHDRILRPLELPAIHRAFRHAGNLELRELIAFDQQLAGQPLLQNFAAASRLAGLNQLRRLRPLRDERRVKRYLAAVETGAANGWHTLVYGLTLAVYSLPLRQGLLAYAQQTTRGFLEAASRSIPISDAEAQKLADELCAHLPAAIESQLAPATGSLS
jgi:urease accessory protein UreF